MYVESGSSSAWYRRSQCLWSNLTSIEGKISIDGIYPELESLFTDIIDVNRVIPGMIHDELLRVSCSGNATAKRIKELLTGFNAPLPTARRIPAPNKLLKCQVLPVRSPGHNDPPFCSSETEFFIVDRDDLFAAFGDRVRCLDFTLQEVCQLKPFISWAGLESRYISRCFEEVSTVLGGLQMPISEPDRDVRRKAYGLLRYVLRT